METILAGDIGGTNTRLTLYDPANLREPLILRRYGSGDYESLQTIIQAFLAECGALAEERKPTRAGFGVAGPVDRDIVKLTNLPWVIDARQIRERIGLERVTFVNDFAANCLAVTQLTAEDLRSLGVQWLTDALATLPGVTVARSGGPGAVASVASRTSDTIPAFNSFWNFFRWMFSSEVAMYCPLRYIA